MSTSYVLSQVANGITLGSIYALVAIGFSMIYSIVRLINFAHGEVLTIGAFAALVSIAGLNLPFPLVVIIALTAGAALGILIERAAFRPLRGSSQVTGFITSLAVAILIENTWIMVIGAQPRSFHIPAGLNHLLEFGVFSLRVIDLITIVMAIVLVIALASFVRFTKMGVAMRATSENYSVARLMGINIDRTILMAFAIGSALAGAAGLMWGSRYGQISATMGLVPGLKAFVAAVIGGVDSIAGAVLGGYVLGMAEVLFVGLLPPEFSGYRNAFVFGMLIVILLFLPNGLLGQNQEKRA